MTSVSLMQNDGKTDTKKTTITFLSDDFTIPSESRICEYRVQNVSFFDERNWVVERLRINVNERHDKGSAGKSCQD